MNIDSKTFTDPRIPNLAYRVTVQHDEYVTPKDYGCYTPKQVEAWKQDDWCYVGVMVEVLLDHEPIGLDEAVWGIEYGRLPLTLEDDTLTGYANLDPLHRYPASVRVPFAPHELEPPDSEFQNVSAPVPDLISEVRSRLAMRLSDRVFTINRALYALHLSGALGEGC